MLSKSLVEEIDRLLKLGTLSQRKIAAQLNVSRGTVAAIAGGRRGLHGREPEEGQLAPLVSQAPPERCRRCGYLVYSPCLVCHSREFHERRTLLRLNAADHPSRAAAAAGARPAGKSRASVSNAHAIDRASSPCRLVIVSFPETVPAAVLI